MTRTPQYVLRVLEPGDRAFVASAWIRGAHDPAPACFIPRARFDPHQRAHVDRCLDTYSTLVACHPDDPSELFAFICFCLVERMPVVHWLYVRNLFRRMGIARSIFGAIAPGAKAVVSTQWSSNSVWIQRRISFFYDPFMVGESGGKNVTLEA